MICPVCGSGKTEFIEDRFQEHFHRKDSTESGQEVGLDVKLKFTKSDKKGKEEHSGLIIPREERWICKNCGDSFSSDEPVTIAGYTLVMSEQFVSDYSRLTALNDMRILFAELTNMLPRRLAVEFKKTDQPKYPFETDVIVKINRIQYRLTCYVEMDEFAYMKVEGMTRK